MQAPEKLVGIVTAAHYSETEKAIKFSLRFENGIEQGFVWPITMFSFPPGSDKNFEMIKTSKIMIGKKIAIVHEDKK